MKKRLFKDSDKEEIIVKGFSFLSIRTAGLLAGYIFTYLITTNFGASAYGLLVLCFSIFLFVGILGRLGLDVNLIRYYSIEENTKDSGLFYRVLIKAFLITTLFSIVLYLFRELIIYELFNKPELMPYYIWMALAIPFWSVALICGGVLRARKNNNWFAFLGNPGRFAFSLIAFILLFTAYEHPRVAIIAHCIAIVVLALLGFVRCMLIFKTFTWKTPVKSWKFIRSSLPMMMSSTALVLLGWMDTFALGIYTPEDQIGIYAIALKVATLASFIFLATSSILAPKLAQFYTDNNLKDFDRLVGFTTKINFISAFLIILGIVILRDWILGIFGEEFIAGSKVLIILCIGQLVMAFSGAVGIIMQMTGKQVAYQNIVLIALLLNIVLNFTLVPVYGILGAAVATAISMAFWNIACAIYIKQKLEVKSYFNPFV